MDVFLREQGCYIFGPFRLDPARRALLLNGSRLKIADRVFDTLLYLVVNQGRLVGRDELLAAVWRGRNVEENNIAQAIFALRKTLQSGGSTETFVVTAPGRGYRFATPVAFEPDPVENRLELAPTPLPAAWDGLPGQAAPASVRRPRLRDRASLLIALAALLLAVASLILWRHAGPSAGGGQEAAGRFAPPPRSVAVLAFENMTGDPGQSYLSDGLAEEMIDALSAMDGLEVAARASSFSFRTSRATIAEMGRKLNVAAVLEGSIRRDGSQLRITARLVDATTGFAFWSRTYDRDQASILTLKDEVAGAVATSLHVPAQEGGSSGPAQGGTSSPAAFDAYLRAAALLGRAGSLAEMKDALAAFDAVLPLDPGFARVHAARAYLLARIANGGGVTDQAGLRLQFEQALAEADRAVALAPRLAATHSVRGLVLGWGFLDVAGGEREEAQARRLSPGSALIERNYASAEVAAGHLEPALAALRHAAELDPVSRESWTGLARGLYMARRYDEAYAAFGHAAALAPRPGASMLYLLGQIELMRGRSEAARAACAAGASWQENEILAIAYHRLGREADAAAQLSALQSRLGESGAYNLAAVYAQWGQPALSLHWLAEAARRRDSGLLYLRVDPMLDPVRDTEGFKTIARQLSLL